MINLLGRIVLYGGFFYGVYRLYNDFDVVPKHASQPNAGPAHGVA